MVYPSSSSYNGSGSRKATNSRPAVLIDVPKVGSFDVDEEEDRGQVIEHIKRQRKPTHFTPYSAIGRNTLKEAKLTFTQEVPTDSFYQKEGSGMSTRGTQQTKKATPQFQSLVAGVPGSRRQEVRRLSSDKSYLPDQFRDASKGTSRAKRRETIEITDSSDDEIEEVGAAGQSRHRSVSQHSSTKTARASRSASGSHDGQDIFGEARVPYPIKRKSESPPDVADWSAPETGIRILPPRKDSPKLAPLPENRSFHISEVASTTKDESGDKVQRTSFTSRMKDREGNRNSSLGGRMESGLKGKGTTVVTKDVKESPGRPIPLAVTSPTADQPQLRLANIGFFDLGKITDVTADPTLSWDIKCNLHLRWMQGESKDLICKSTNIDKIEIYDEGSGHCLIVHFKDSQKVFERLCHLVGEAAEKVLIRPQKQSQNIVLRPLTDHFDAVLNRQAWQDLLKVIRESFIPDISLQRGTFLMLAIEFEGLQDLIKASEAGKPNRVQPKPRPAAGRLSIKTEPAATRSSLRQKRDNSSTEEEEEKTSIASVEAATKVQAPTEPQKALLSYPIGAIGAVNVFQSDVDKLDDQEMLNDTIIELGLRYLLEGIKKRNPDLHEQIYVFSSFFYKRISEGRRDRKAAYEFVKKWTKKLDIFKKKYLVVPINEKMHWYLAVVTNPYYAVREVERRKGLYESDQEEDEEKDIGSKGKRVDGDEAVEGSDKVVKEGVSAADVEEGVEQPSERKDTLGDTPMEEAKKTTIEVVIPQSSGESDKSARDKMSEQMDLDEKEKPIFEMVHSPELQERSLEHRTQTTPVVDKRSTKGPFALAHAIDVDKDDDVQVLTQTLSPRKAKQSPYRPGVSDGFRNKGKGPLVGGGGPSGTPIEAGQIASFRKDEEEASAAAMKKRKAEDEDGDAHMESPPFRSRSGASYGAMSKVYSRASSTETTQEKHQHWLKRKAVVCVFDSLGSTHKAVRTALREYLCLEYNDKKGGQIEVDEVELEHIDVVSPMQGNFCDCGLYLLHAFERFFHDPTHVMDEVIVSRDRTDPYWQAEDAAQKRQWWRECIQHLIEEYKSEQDLRKAEKEARKRGGGKEKSETTSPSDSRSRTATSEGSQVDMASIESSLEEPTVSKAT